MLLQTPSASDDVVSLHQEDGSDRRPAVTSTTDESYSRRKAARKREEFPPAIASLDLPEKMPSVMKRYHTSDGRLILREETATHHEYFRAHRSNGRLRLELVSLNDVFRDQGREGEDEGGVIECGEEHGNLCSGVESQPSIKRLCSREVALTGTNSPVRTL